MVRDRNAHGSRELSEDSWTRSVTADLERSRKIAWIVAAVASAIALLLALALIIVLPLKTVVPYTLLVDRQTGNVEALEPLEETMISPDTALTRSFLAQYVIARESFDPAAVQRDYRRTALWSSGDARRRYMETMNGSNPASPFARLPPGTTIETEITSVSSLGRGSALVRFATVRSDRGGTPLAPQYWAAVVNYGYSEARMSEADRLLNPLGFQVTRYRRDQETLAPPQQPAPAYPMPPGTDNSG